MELLSMELLSLYRLKGKMLAKNLIDLIRKMVEGATALVARRRLVWLEVPTMTRRPALAGKTLGIADTCPLGMPDGSRISKTICRQES